MEMLQLYTFSDSHVPVIVTLFFCFGTWAQHDSAPLLCGCLTRIREVKKSRFQLQTNWGNTLALKQFPRRYLAAQAPPVLPLVYLSWVNSQYHLEDWWDPFNKKDFFRQKEIREKPTLQWEALPKAGQTSVADFEWTLPRQHSKGYFLSLQFASYTGYWFSQPAWAFQVKWKYTPRTAMRSFYTPTTRCLMKLSPPPVQLRFFYMFFFQLIMVYHWFIILDPTSVSFAPLMWSQNITCFLSSPCGELAFSDSNRHGRRCKRRVGETLHVIVGWMPTPYLSGLPA